MPQFVRDDRLEFVAIELGEQSSGYRDMRSGRVAAPESRSVRLARLGRSKAERGWIAPSEALPPGFGPTDSIISRYPMAYALSVL